MDENARSLRPDFQRVNDAKASDRGIERFFRKGSGSRSDRSHAPRGNASMDALRPLRQGRGATRAAFPRRA
ncbi:hypothetical protein CUN61_26455 [Pseudomonas arsenicoxydans]|uniref:DUF1534 domain-containing protein n=1 Tax=Pseudomonas arsenicoxydans TaxID=702115 RepID=A0A4P6G6Q1_9PSED|nr:hypothetical protein CUN61_26455 [Pseudomonas arsenicoxydans]